MNSRECRYPEYETLDSRLKSYKDWPLRRQPRPKKLAEAGFFYTGEEDRTQCFFCGGGLEAWEPNANPWEQHVGWFDCEFALRELDKEYVRTVVGYWWGNKELNVSTKLTNKRMTCCSCNVKTPDKTNETKHEKMGQIKCDENRTTSAQWIGGGRPDIPLHGRLQGQVVILLGPSLDGLDNSCDSDLQFSDQAVPNNIEIIKVAETQGGDTDVPSTSYASPTQVPKPSEDENLKLENPDKNVWCNRTPKALKTKVSNALSTDTKDMWLCRRRPKTYLQDKVLQSKLGLIETMKKNTYAEAAVKEKILEEQLRQEKIKTEILQVELEEIRNRTKNSE